MKYPFLIAGLMAAMLSACGGGSSDTSATASTNIDYHFVTPTVGATYTFAETLVDDLNNTINRTLVERVQAVNADGSFTATWNDPSNNSVTTGTVDHTFYPTTDTVNNAAQTLSSVVTRSDGTVVNCQTAPYGAGAPSPLSAGENWTTNYTETCNGNASSYSQNGTYVGTESITVPAGTFVAYKFQSRIAWTSGSRQMIESVTAWRNASTSNTRLLKEDTTFSYSGYSPAQGALVARTRILQSYQ